MKELIARLRAMREHGGRDYACMDEAADALEAMSGDAERWKFCMSHDWTRWWLMASLSHHVKDDTIHPKWKDEVSKEQCESAYDAAIEEQKT